MKSRVIIADDHAIIREGLKRLLEEKGFEVVDIAKDGREAIDYAEKYVPDIVLMDISMPGLNGFEATSMIHRKLPDTRIIALSMHSSKKMIDNMFASGASGYILKESAFDEICEAIDQVSKGNYYLTPSIARMYLKNRSDGIEQLKEKKRDDELSSKEIQVLQLVAEGEKNRDIASILDISQKTVENHRRNIMKKLNISTVAGLTKYAVKEGISSL